MILLLIGLIFLEFATYVGLFIYFKRKADKIIDQHNIRLKEGISKVLAPGLKALEEAVKSFHESVNKLEELSKKENL